MATSFALTQNNHIICIAHKLVPSGLKFPIQFIEHDVTQQRTQWPSLWYTLLAGFKLMLNYNSCIQVLMDERNNPPVLYPSCQYLYQLAVIDLIEKFLQVNIHCITVTFGDVVLALSQCLMCIALWSEPVTVRRKLRLINRSKHLCYCLLDYPVHYGRDA